MPGTGGDMRYEAVGEESMMVRTGGGGNRSDRREFKRTGGVKEMTATRGDGKLRR